MNSFGDSEYTGITCIGDEKIDVDATVVSLTVPKGAKGAFFVFEANAGSVSNAIVARFRENGQSPDATNGMPLVDRTVYEIREGSLQNIRFVSIDSFVHTLFVNYYA